ncbi:MAG: hypothetical protein A4S17_02665 [Proteobacteria bacterium HN_bin10]|nr:MAG: hypothetical protein A4S17_02665 [Proteobacteria bacterium HN_bin10]
MNVELIWEGGRAVIALRADRALASVNGFLSAIETTLCSRARIYRATRSGGEASELPPIEVLQVGVADLLSDAEGAAIPKIQHEPTSTTGLRHRAGAVSLARGPIGTAFGDFFVCMRDEPSLDEGGARSPDGAGFAVFGEVTEGLQALQALHQSLLSDARPPRGMLTNPLPVTIRVEAGE